MLAILVHPASAYVPRPAPHLRARVAAHRDHRVVQPSCIALGPELGTESSRRARPQVKTIVIELPSAAIPTVEPVPMPSIGESSGRRRAPLRESEVQPPRLGEIAKFALPTLGMWLAPPLLSLVDTSVVGMHCATSSLAALAPSTKLCDYLSYCCTALGAATTNLATERFAQQQPDEAKRVVSGSVTIALVLGVALAVGVPLVAKPLLGAMMGGAAAADATVLSSATQYAVIRALGFPAAMLTMVLQAGFLAAKDSFSPLVAVPLAALTNLALDVFLVGTLGLGTAGAAWGTVGSLYVNAAVLSAMWVMKARTIGSRAAPLISRPSMPELRKLLGFALPMVLALSSRVGMGLSITVAATALGTAALAANQVVESCYWLFCPFGEALSLSMQAYLPAVAMQSRRAAAQLKRTCRRAAMGLALATGCAAALAPVVRPGLFTSCVAVRGSMAAAAPLLGASVATFVLMAAAEGMLIARKQLRLLAASHTVISALLVSSLLVATRTAGCGLRHVWGLIALCNGVRFAHFALALRNSEAAADRGAALAEGVPNIAEAHPHLL